MIFLISSGQRRQKASSMNLEKLTSPRVREAIEALQAGDKASWLALFAVDATLTDDGKPRSFTDFSDDAVGHERFTSIDRVDNDGFDVYGRFHSDRWGDFAAYFKFHLGPDGKFARLDIGQVVT
jgi:hypothetical protein